MPRRLAVADRRRPSSPRRGAGWPLDRAAALLAGSSPAPRDCQGPALRRGRRLRGGGRRGPASEPRTEARVRPAAVRGRLGAGAGAGACG